MKRQSLGNSGIQVPPIIFGTSCLGNLYEAPPYEEKLASVQAMMQHVPAPVVLDSAGKYGAGLSLETIGRCLRDLQVPPEDVMISNKLGWQRVPLTTPEPTFEPGTWKDLEYDARQAISYRGIIACWEQGLELLAEPYRPALVSVHDPDEYLEAAADEVDRRSRWQDILGAYRALDELKAAGELRAIGVGSKDWTVIRDLVQTIDLDWVMLACSFTLYRHPPEILSFMEELRQRGIGIINSAVFNAGFLLGGQYFDYRVPDPESSEDERLFVWRARFLACCRQHGVTPAAACVQFALSAPGIAAVALNTSRPSRIPQNVELVQATLPPAFWQELRSDGLIGDYYQHLPVY